MIPLSIVGEIHVLNPECKGLMGSKEFYSCKIPAGFLRLRCCSALLSAKYPAKYLKRSLFKKILELKKTLHAKKSYRNLQ